MGGEILVRVVEVGGVANRGFDGGVVVEVEDGGCAGVAVLAGVTGGEVVVG